MITEFSSYIKGNIVEEIKNFLVEDNGESSWKNFVDHQKMGDCQGIVASIIRQFPQAKKVFGGIKLDEPCVDWDDGSENDEITHHWVEINGEIYDFSKGTLKGYIDGIEEEMYDPEVIDDWRYKDIGYYLKKEGWNPFRKKRVIPTGIHSEFDPYGEEVWEDDDMSVLKSNFYVLYLEGKWSRVCYKVRNKYLIVAYLTKDGRCTLTPGFESGFSNFGNANFQYLPNISHDNLKQINDDDFQKVMAALDSPNMFAKSDGIHPSNLELLKSRFVN